MSAKKCPYCGVRVSFWRRATSGSLYFTCGSCGNRLKEDWKRSLPSLLAIWLLATWFLIKVDDDWRYVLGVFGAIGLALYIDNLLLRLLPAESDSE